MSFSDRIEVPREVLIQIGRELELLVVSLDRIGSAYAHSSGADQNAAIADFHDQYDVFHRLARARGLLYNALDAVPMSDQQRAELDHALTDVEYWTPKSSPDR